MFSYSVLSHSLLCQGTFYYILYSNLQPCNLLFTLSRYYHLKEENFATSHHQAYKPHFLYQSLLPTCPLQGRAVSPPLAGE